jgi:hypothetical protein
MPKSAHHPAAIRKPELLMIFKKPILQDYLKKMIFLVPIFFGLVSCQKPENAGEEKLRLMEELAGKLPDGKAFQMDSITSEIKWVIRKNRGEFVSGIFKPGSGYLLMEGSSLAAGFWSGDLFFSSRVNKDVNQTILNEGQRFMKDSLPILFRPSGRKVRMDIRQVSRVVPKSEFKGALVQDSIDPAYDILIQAELADSSQALRIPMKVKQLPGRVQLSGAVQLNLREFGILSKPASIPNTNHWIPEVSLEFLLNFKSDEKEIRMRKN